MALLTALSCPAGPAVLDMWWEPLQAALFARGPGLLPVPDGPSRDGVLAMARIDEPLETDAALVVPTSGSTGEVKGALLPAAAVLHSARATLTRLGGPGRWLLALPIAHIAGLQVLVRSIVGGEPPVCLNGFSTATFAAGTRALGDERRYTALVPTQLARLLEAEPHVLASYYAVLVGGAATTPDLLDRARELGVNVVTTYGMSETCGGCVYDGQPLDDVMAHVDDDGRIHLGGPVVFTGYRLRPDLTEGALTEQDAVRWHVTNDAGELTEGGRLRVLGRLDEVIVTGGEKVAPSLVETAVAEIPSIRECAVVGAPDPEWGQRVVAVVVPAEPAAIIDLPNLRTQLAASLPSYALPRELVIVDALPRIGPGKVDRAALARSLTAGR